MGKRFRYRLLILILALGLCIDCVQRITTIQDVTIRTRQIYGKSQNSDRLEIEKIFLIMVRAILEDDMEALLPFIHPKEGVWVDLKALWTKKEYERDIRDPNGYIPTYFLSTEKLRARKNNDTSLSVKEILQISGGFSLDYYFETPDDCEVDILFINKTPEEGNLANPVFRKIQGRWYIYRFL